MSNIYRLTAIYQHCIEKYPQRNFRIQDCKFTGDTATVDITIDGKPCEETFKFDGDKLEV